jgi:osmotically-inducible protein OsmY
VLANPAGVSATVENGIVTLRGTVSDPGEARVLASMVRMTPGVRGVKNDLAVAKP